MDVRKAILARAEALADFLGQRAPPASARTLDRAAKIASGTVFFYRKTPVEVGLSGIDWSGSHIKHQEWPAQLNRFSYLGPLASAYRETGEERFALAARAPRKRSPIPPPAPAPHPPPDPSGGGGGGGAGGGSCAARYPHA